MRLQIFDENGNRIGTLTNYKDRAITESLDSGDKELSFLYPITGPMTDLLKEECYIRTKTDEFVLKSVDMGDNYNTYTASLNVEGLEAAVFVSGFESVEKTVEECLNTAFVGTGWKVKVYGVTKRRTIRETDSTSAWNILQKALTTYRCECSIDSLSKSVEIYERIGEDKGCYFMEGLNIKKPTKKSDTYDFYTRIYPIGKDGITPAAITGKDYIDNFQYSKKVKPFVWKDERYTDVDSLVEDATAKLEELSRPHKEFAVEVKDLAKAKTSESNVYTDILSYEIGDTVTLISKTGRIREKQRIVKLVRYPESPEKNTAEISNASKTFAEIQQEEVDSLSDSIADEVENRKEEDSKTTVRLEKTEQSIEAEVSQRIAENLELATKIASTAHKISMTATGGEKSVGIVIQLYDENGNLIDTTSGAANIEVTGFVKFNDLANAGSTVINGANITTGTISCDRLNGGTIKGQKLEGCKAEFDDGAESLRLKYSDDYYMGFRAGYIYCHHNNPGNIYQSIVFDNLMRIGVNSNADCWGNGSGILEPTYYMEINKYGGINFNCINLSKNNSAIATKSDIPDMSDYLKKNASGKFNADYASSAGGLSGQPSVNLNNCNASDFYFIGSPSAGSSLLPIGYNSSTYHFGHYTGSSERFKNRISDVEEPALDPHRLYDTKICQYKYNTDYLSNPCDCRYNRFVIGFIAEDLETVYPVAVDKDDDGVIMDWNYKYIIPPMLALIQEQHQEIESLKKEFTKMCEKPTPLGVGWIAQR